MKHRLLAWLRASEAGRRLLKFYRMLRFQIAHRGETMQQIFTRHYHENWWGSPESRSGGGSTLAYTAGLRRELADLTQALGVRSFLDAPCGDFHWFQHVELPPGTRYIGGDIVPPMIEENQRRYGSDVRSFRLLDITRDPLPAADLWMCRAVFIHFADRDIWATLANFLRSDIRWLLTTTIPGTRQNRDIASGFFRNVNLVLPPFSFPPPSRIIDDGVMVGEEIKIALWDREALRASLESNHEFQRFVRERAT